MDTKKFEKLALILLILFAVSIGITFFSKVFLWFFAPGLPESHAFIAFSLHAKILSAIYAVFVSMVSIGCGIWLYITAKANNVNYWIWTFLGLFSGIFAIILWFLWQIYGIVKKEK